MKLAVLGFPVSHSRSPALHTHWLRQNGIEGSYDAVEISPETLEDQFGRLLEAGYSGFNVTVPLKQDIKTFCDFLSPEVQATNAVNTIHLKSNKLYAYNTDIYGFQKNIEDNASSFRWNDGPACLIGAGGAARAAAYVLRENGAPEIRIVNRSVPKGVDLAADFGGHFVAWENRADALKDANILINATSVGMVGKPDLDLDLDQLPRKALVTDIVYTPEITSLLGAAQERGNPIVTGTDMFFYQAQQSFSIWTGTLPEIDEASRKAVAA